MRLNNIISSFDLGSNSMTITNYNQLMPPADLRTLDAKLFVVTITNMLRRTRRSQN